MDFEQWIGFLFDRPTEGDQKWYEALSDEPNIAAEQALDFMTRTFRSCGVTLKNFSDDQIALGIDYLMNPAISDFVRLVNSKSLDLDKRAACLETLTFLYDDCFAARCIYEAGNITPSGLNGVCYRLWDRSGLAHLAGSLGKKKRGSGDVGQRGEAVHNVFRSALRSQNLACVQSALHGLAHAHRHAPPFVEAIIDDFLNLGRTDLPSEIITYANQARRGLPT